MEVVVWLVTFCLLVVSGNGQLSRFRPANIFADDMVLQMEPKSAQVWGYGDPGAPVTVRLLTERYSTTVSPEGKWSVRLAPQPAGGPLVLGITHGTGDLWFLNVWFGDVWVCSGQSNMQMPLSRVFNATAEVDKALQYPQLRLLHLTNVFSEVELEELENVTTLWQLPSEENVPDFSALCLLYGERLSDSLGGRPIGLIDTTWGGTRIEAWSSPRATTFCNTPPFSNSEDPNADHVLWNAMIKPLTSLAVRGAIWYQGESNVDYNAEYYSCHVQRLVHDWSSSFVDGDVAAENGLAFPFGIVQIGPYSAGDNLQYGALRWHQTIDLGVLPNVFMPETFMASTYDLTDPESPTGDIHFRDKQTIATRLANTAKSLLYDEDFHKSGPIVVMAVESSPGTLTMTYDMEIEVRGTAGFSYRLPDNSWVQTSITSVSGRDVTVTFEPTATHLAYGFLAVVCDYKKCSIYSGDSQTLPAQVWLWNLEDIRKTNLENWL